MFANYIVWLCMGVGVGYLGYFFDVNKHKGGLLIYLVLGTMGGFLGAFLIHFLVWATPANQINVVATLFAAFFAYKGLRAIDFFFGL